jgi:pimeloyl-ACP methyl ester carboxylesterase
MNWLFLRGLSREARHWGDFRAAFEKQVTGSRVVCLDLPGTGSEFARPSPWRISQMVDDLRSRWLALRGVDAAKAPTDEKWSVLGMSLGGMVAMNWCERFPDEFARVVLINTSARGLSSPLQRLGLGNILKVFRIMAAKDAREREEAVLSLVSNKERAGTPVADTWATIAKTSPVKRTTVIRQLLAAAVYGAPRKLAQPTLIISSKADHLVDPICSKRLSERFASPICFHDTAGHDLPLDDPEWVANQIAQWNSTPMRPANA